jgi:hypothetical protein
MFPGMSGAWAPWGPELELSTLFAFHTSGSNIGATIISAVGGILGKVTTTKSRKIIKN